MASPGLTDALPDTSNLRVWDAGRPRWVSPFAGASSAAQREPRRSGAKDLCPVSDPEEEMSGVRQRQHFT